MKAVWQVSNKWLIGCKKATTTVVIIYHMYRKRGAYNGFIKSQGFRYLFTSINCRVRYPGVALVQAEEAASHGPVVDMVLVQESAICARSG